MQPHAVRFTLLVQLLLLANLVHVTAQEDDTRDSDDVAAGHSAHGEAFNEGPRQAAYLMPGLGQVEFPASTESELAQRFVNQGVAQLHGFWYYEAERSFRQAAVLDPECAICYWGMAMANVENRKRARDFIARAVALKGKATKREQMYIEGYERFCRDEDDKGKKIEKKSRAQTYTHDLEDIVAEYPQDVEAKAFLALQLWQNERSDLPIVSHMAINAVLQDVFDANPNHPAHHYRIHLWDKPKPERALASAALCGQSLPAIAHMWHMPGHIYSKLHRYQDAVWQQEASARVDHAHMMRDRVLPDQIHNFAHNNEWLIRNLLKVGRVHDALSLAENMLELPRHPKYNSISKGSAKYGRERLLLTLSTYRMWPELIQLARSEVLESTEKLELQVERTRYLGVAQALSGNAAEAVNELASLTKNLEDITASIAQLEKETKQEKESLSQKTAAVSTDSKCDEQDPQPAADSTAKSDVAEQSATELKAATETKESLSKADALKLKANQERRTKDRAAELKKLQAQVKVLEKAIASVQAAQAAAQQDYSAALKLWPKSDLTDNLLKAEWLADNGKFEEAIAAVDKVIDSNPNEVPALAVKTWLQYEHQGASAANTSFASLRTLACTADLDTPLLTRLLPLAAEIGEDSHWAANYVPATDIGTRPDFDTLGPFRWHPYLAPDFAVQDTNEKEVRLKQYAGKPTLVIFYLGFGCLHCVEQLHAFSPRADEFRQAGVEVVAISTETLPSLKTALTTYSKPLNIPLHADPDLTAFKAYRCFDDFEQKPLHGTFLLDQNGRVLWQDISYEPFMDVDFALQESSRLLKLAGFINK